MNQDEQALDFSTVIASTVHDMKNSLAMLMQAQSQWLARLPEAQRGGVEQGVIDFEFAHLNGMLVQLLGLYKLGVNQMPLQPAYHELDDFIEAQLAAHQEVFASRGIIATYEVDPLSPLGFFDRELIASVLGNCINNAIRYARESLLITVSDEAGQLVLSINDDGDGYPAEMLERQADYVQGINHSSGSTGLGLYFASRIAALHQRNGVVGHTEISNGGPLGGGVFSLYLP
ncbi:MULTISPECIES: sensor histidine kinase [unclassified Pseudomonas]|jgi:signal transduction histidine kinase|uniref:sensor histidine kinase n=1 Tax=unclassified Pseudomonas TaxID=196821 RepID=UPI000C84271D|nr:MULTISPECIES: HAMP domain-containing sensor histidine kinase [unclassified Pseudomonas]MDX9673364.1 HAMP domain-containing sensor histidine kinase [Pseudomonas sp. P8_250]PMQ14046.1 Sensor protein CreC [Pseudomonas sp. AD21]WPN38100.1 HAMP domain-containing sensor histidine kinase [Pseudomonas sp. P8_139]WPN40097.1 HAMP domain-containing sensor histidine kinase [Pseudomonas sp. P8_229]